MEKRILFFGLVILVVPLVAAILNPSPIYCENMGYIYNDTHCIFDDGNFCELWDFYNGDCGQEYVKELICKELDESVPPGYECCEGLVPIGQASVGADNVCAQQVGGWSICAACGDGICAKINPSRYGEWENECNCPLDCSDQVCKPEGYEYWINPLTRNFQCCEGSKHISIFISYYSERGICGVLLGWILCSNCGNDVCEEWEHACTCEEDCEFPVSSEQLCPEGCVCDEEIVTCPAYETDIEKINITDSTDGVGFATCPKGCICEGGTITCPVEGEKIDVEIIPPEDYGGPTQGQTGEQDAGTITALISMTKQGDKIKIKSGDVEVVTSEDVSVIDSTLTMTTSNGRTAEIKIMPETALETAIERLGELNFTVELKEVGKEDEAKPVYELTGEKQGKFLGIFKIMARVQIQVDAENGEVIKIIKPWWSFLASGI